MLFNPYVASSSYSISGIVPSNETSDSKCTCEIPRSIENYIDFAENVIDPFSRNSWTFIPGVTYPSETNLGLGIFPAKI